MFSLFFICFVLCTTSLVSPHSSIWAEVGTNRNEPENRGTRVRPGWPVLAYAEFDDDPNLQVGPGENDILVPDIRCNANDGDCPVRFESGFRGQALSISVDDPHLTFMSTELINPDRGSISFWTKLVDWDFSMPEMGTYFFRLLNDSGQPKAFLYKYPNWVDQFTLIYKHSKYETLDYNSPLYHVGYTAPLVLDQNEWAHVVMTWSGRAIAFYTNGTLVWKHEMRDPFDGSEHGHGLNFGVHSGTHQTLLDEFTIFDYPLGDAEVASLYASYQTSGPPAWPGITPCRVDAVYYPIVEKVQCTAVPRTEILGWIPASVRFHALDQANSYELGVIDVNHPGDPVVGIFDLPEDVSKGWVSIRAELLDNTGSILYSESSESFEKRIYPWQDQARDVGLTNAVIDPFTPLRVHSKKLGNSYKVSCWGRSYIFGRGGLPRKIFSRKSNLLSAPVSLKAQHGWKELAVTGGNFVITNSTEGIVEFTSDLLISRMPVEVRGTIEYDGMIRYDLVFDENSYERLTNLTLEIVIPDEHAQLYHVARDQVRTTNEAGAIPPGTGKVWPTGAVAFAGLKFQQDLFYYALYNTSTPGPAAAWGGIINTSNPGRMHELNWVCIELADNEIIFFSSPDGGTWYKEWTVNRPGEMAGPPVKLRLGANPEGNDDPYRGRFDVLYFDNLIVGTGGWETPAAGGGGE